LKKHGKKYSQTYKKYNSGLWEDNFDAMATKTVLKMLLSKFAPLSIDIQKATVVDQAVIKDWEGNELEYPDNKPLDADEVSKEKEQVRVLKHIENAKTTEDLEGAELIEYINKQPEESEIRTIYAQKLLDLKKQV
jgi:recombination protein RecT